MDLVRAVGVVGGVVGGVAAPHTHGAEHQVAGLAAEQLLAKVEIKQEEWSHLVTSTWPGWQLQVGMVSLFCRAIRSISWLTMKEGGRARRPPGGILTRSRHIGHLQHTVSTLEICKRSIGFNNH